MMGNYYGNGSMMGGAWGFWLLICVGFVFLLLIIVGLVFVFRGMMGHRPNMPPHHQMSESPIDILNRRYAAGEIDKAEYDKRKQDLGS